MIKEQQETFYKAIGKALTYARKRRNISIAQLAKLSGEQNKTIRYIENGSVCSLHHAAWMIEILGMNINDIIEGMDNEESKLDSII